MVDTFRRILENISKAPLKPQQRLYIMRANAIPKLGHSLVLGRSSRKTLRQLDLMTREAVRRWTGLPGDCPIGFIHAHAKDGGLGIASFQTSIPRLVSARRERLVGINDEDVKSMLASETWLELSKFAPSTRIAGTLIDSKPKEQSYWQERLWLSVDGKGLANVVESKSSTSWVVSGTSLMSGFGFRQALKIRSGTWYTLGRASRGRGTVPMCESGCNSRQVLSHMVQSCSRVHDRRVRSHDRLVAFLHKRLVSKHDSCLLEPKIASPVGIRKPDLLVKTHDGNAWIIDVQVTSDAGIGSLSAAFDRKVEYYRQSEEAIRKFLWPGGNAVNKVQFGAVVVSWRGALCGRSDAVMGSLGLGTSDKVLVSVKAVEGSVETAKTWAERTERRIIRR